MRSISLSPKELSRLSNISLAVGKILAAYALHLVYRRHHDPRAERVRRKIAQMDPKQRAGLHARAALPQIQLLATEPAPRLPCSEWVDYSAERSVGPQNCPIKALRPLATIALLLFRRRSFFFFGSFDCWVPGIASVATENLALRRPRARRNGAILQSRGTFARATSSCS